MPPASLNSSTRQFSPVLREFIAGTVVFAAVVASRHASINCPAELSADESELLVQVGRYGHDLMPWRSVDGSTIGPLNPWFLLLAKSAGWPMNYPGLHLLGALLLGAIAAVSYYTVRLFLPLLPAGFVGLTGVLVLGCTASVNFMYFATELLPEFALCLAVFGLAWSRQKRQAPEVALILAAGLAGMAPWAKLQSAPISLLLCGFAVWTAGDHGGPAISRRSRLLLVTIVAAFAALPSIIILTVVELGGVFEDFRASYIVANLGYAERLTGVDAGRRFLHILERSELNGLMAASAILGLLCLVWLRSNRLRAALPATGIFVFTFLYLGASVYACVRPPNEFEHYHIFLIGPLLLVMGALLCRLGITQLGNNGVRIHGWLGLAVAGALVSASVPSALHYKAGAPLRKYLATIQREQEDRIPAVFTRGIAQVAPQARTMVVWGWMPSLYVKSGLASATRQTISHFLIDAGPSREFLRRRFLEDVRDSQPDVIVDAVASGCFTWRWDVETARLESFPEFAAYVHANYFLGLNLASDPTGVPLRVFLKKIPAPPAR